MVFMKYLIKELEKEDSDWRSQSIFLLDGARYHTSEDMRDYLKKMQVDVIYSGPYSYSAAPIEMLFSALKNGNLNPNKV